MSAVVRVGLGCARPGARLHCLAARWRARTAAPAVGRGRHRPVRRRVGPRGGCGELTPRYTGGPTLLDKSHLAVERTRTPVELDPMIKTHLPVRRRARARARRRGGPLPGTLLYDMVSGPSIGCGFVSEAKPAGGIRRFDRGIRTRVTGVVVATSPGVDIGGFPLLALESTASAEVLDRIERRVLWLSVAMIDHANRVRENPSGLKVGGHQASSASMVSIMTALWLEQLTAADRVSVKPHASPVLHAINYLLGRLDKSSLTTLRAFGGLQSYPSRSKDPDPVDYSTGSVGLGATAPVWGAVARRYVEHHFGAGGTGRQYALIGDAELDEGACWEALLDPAIPGLGELVWIVDVARPPVTEPGPWRSRPILGAPRRGWRRLSRHWDGPCWICYVPRRKSVRGW